MGKNSNKRIKVKLSEDGKRSDRVKKTERERMLRLRGMGKTIEEIALELGRDSRTVSKQLAKAESSRQQNKKMFDPIIIEAKKKHIADMLAIAEELLANGLDIVRKHPSSGDTDKYEYSTVIGDSMEVLSHEQLGDRLRVNIGLQWVHMNAEDIDCFLTHLKADYNDLESKDILTVVAHNPYELIETLRVLGRKRTFKGTCEVCKDW